MPTNARTYTCLLMACTHKGDVETLRLVLNSMRAEGVTMNAYHFNQIIKLYTRGDHLQEAFSVLNAMQDANVKPTLVTYNTLIAGCARNRSTPSTCRWLTNPATTPS